MPSILDRYSQHREDLGSAENKNLLDKGDGNVLTQYIENVEILQRNYVGEDLERLSLQELVKLEHHFRDSLSQIRLKKGERLIQELEYISEQVAGVSKSTNAESSFLDKLLDISPSDRVGSHASVVNSICTVQSLSEHYQTSAVWADASTSQPSRKGAAYLARCGLRWALRLHLT